MIGMILIRVLVNISTIVKMTENRNVLAEVILNVTFIKVIWKDQVIQDLWLKI